MDIKCKLLDPQCVPYKKYSTDAGLDLRARIPKLVSISQFSTIQIPTGICVEIPDGYMGMLMPRSGHVKEGITIEMPPIDTGFTGELIAFVTNNTSQPYHLQPYEKFCQLVIVPIAKVDKLVFVDELPVTDRGNSMLNSTGK